MSYSSTDPEQKPIDVETSDIVASLNDKDTTSETASSEDTISKNQDSNQKISMIFTTLFEIYRVLMSSLLLMFVPQMCGDEQCGLSDKVFPENGYEKFVACHNYVVMSIFFVFYYLEIKRELNFINYLDKKTLPNDFWIIHIRDITETEFKKPNTFLNYTIKEKKYFNRLELYQLKKNGT